jgi:hypothetical protein
MRQLLLVTMILLGATIAYGKPTKRPKRKIQNDSTLTIERAILAMERGEECAIFRRLEIKTVQTIANYEEQIQTGHEAAKSRRTALETCAQDFGISDWETEPGLVQVAEVCSAPLEGFVLVGKRNTVSHQDIEAAREQLQYVRTKMKNYCRPLHSGARVSLK